MDRVKIIKPCTCDVGQRAPIRVNAYCEIRFVENSKLRIHGVIGPMRNGNCYGNCGQCIDEIRAGEPTEGWTPEMLQKFCDIWDKWHLNDMRPYCQHQKELGWDKLAFQKVTLYNYVITEAARKQKKAAERAALEALWQGQCFTPTKEQVKYASMPYRVAVPCKLTGDALDNYEPVADTPPAGGGFTEEKVLGWLSPDEHPDGLLDKPCPVCGYKYGHGWLQEEVPHEIIDWLFALPDSNTKPAWV